MARKLLKGIYKITNVINGKFYIGSSNDIKDRWREHICHLNQNKHHSKHLQRAWNKYGKENFKLSIVEYVDNEEELLNIEQHWLDKTNGYNREIGYNVSKQASGVCLIGKDNGFFGKEHTETTKRHLSKVRKTMYNGNNNPMYGKKHTKETKEKISIANKGRIWTEEHKKRHSEIITGYNNGRCRRVICITTGKVFNYIKEAGEFYNLKTTNHITSCCKGRRKSCGKLSDGTPLKWMYYEEYIKTS